MSAARPQHLFPLFADIQTLSGVGPKTAPLLERAMGGRIKDLLLTAPTGAIDRSNRPGIANALAGEIGTFLVTIGSHKAPSNRNRPYKITVYDNSGEMEIIYFKARSAQMEQLFPEGKERLISGKTESFNAQLQMTHPDYVLDPQKSDLLPLIEPLYPLTAGLSQKMAGKTVRAALSVFETIRDMGEWLDSSFVSQQNWSGFQESLKTLHNPSHAVDISAESPIRRRLAYDELFAKQLAIALVRESTRRAHGREFRHDGHYVQDVLNAAPFKPTGAQSRAFEEIEKDMQSPFRMARLLQGDVGAGKTFVAALAAAYAAEAGVQTALMAPTEILARQHAETLSALLEPAGLTVQAITGRDKGKARQALNSGLEAGYIDVVVGTHALFQDTMTFKDLGLVIIDEQHRFGVRDRLRLANKGQAPDLLVMTATPIPRTLALTSYGDLDSVKLDEKPAGRKPIETRILPLQRLDDVIDGIGRQIQEGNQVYWVCPLVEESELIDLTSAEDRHRQLTAIYGDKVGLLHGRMNGLEKEQISNDFKAARYKVLVATTVIEVGVDAPDATIIVIEHAERFGLAQLHQLRGRVGRSDKQSSCLLLYKGPLSVSGKARLEVMRESEDGFMIAEKDWELRGSGDLLGARQSGLPDYAFANLDKHKSLLETAVQDARLLVQNDPELKSVRGKAARDLLFLFEQDYGIALMRAG
ncbi:ATP-dependent DNA helicase RecG [Litorimonas haliclonae]|uniref:ATP-dependent DNA helicase RecG n=1 Tax=Litorimonas haliclonae TaxID=2081977 RepID=UPI0039EF8833